MPTSVAPMSFKLGISFVTSSLSPEKEIDVYNIVIDELMIRTPITVSSNLLAVEALKLMNDRNISALPVVDDGKLVGTIRINDITGMGIVL